MKVHRLNCGTMCPRGARFVNGKGGVFARGRMVCHCLLIESDQGLILVDTGLGLLDLAKPRARLGLEFLAFAGPRLDPAETAIRQVERLGFKRDDVRHIVPTHLDLDHIGGVPDFPNAEVHVLDREHAAGMAPPTFLERFRYRNVPRDGSVKWVVHSLERERWFGFESVRAVPGTQAEVLLIPLFGHTRGHCGVAVKTEGKWLLHAGDAYFFHGEVDPEKPRGVAGLDMFQKIIQVDGAARVANQARLRELRKSHGSEVEVFCAHDPTDFPATQPTS